MIKSLSPVAQYFWPGEVSLEVMNGRKRRNDLKNSSNFALDRSQISNTTQTQNGVILLNLLLLVNRMISIIEEVLRSSNSAVVPSHDSSLIHENYTHLN